MLISSRTTVEEMLNEILQKKMRQDRNFHIHKGMKDTINGKHMDKYKFFPHLISLKDD